MTDKSFPLEILEQVISQNSGAVVQTIGDAVMAIFAYPLDSVKAAIEILQEIDLFNHKVSDDIRLKIGIHHGSSIVVNLNDRLDYFG